MTTEPKWTPGPWKVRKSGWRLGNAPYYDIVTDEAACEAAWLADCGERPLAVHDAHLIAAAPQLYAALQRAMRELDCAADQLARVGHPGHADDIRITLDACNGALTKARGEA